jgi:TatA/E family protein of Tat protein translocase
MLGIGMQEMMLIALAALLIFGPGKLPEVMGQAGKLYKDFRNMTSELTGEFEKTVAEAKEMGNQLTGELGPMQKQVDSVTKSVQRDLGKGSKSSSTSKAKTSTGAKTTTGAKSSTSSTSSAKKATTSRTSSTKSTSSSTSAAKTTTSTASKKPTVAPAATKEDPYSDLSMFALEEPTRTRRARRATPSVITDPTPREMAMADSEPANGTSIPSVSPVNDAIARARQRRQNAGYAQRSA